MSALSDERLEIFAQALARGEYHSEAARGAGYKHKVQRSAARAEQKRVVARVAEIERQAAGGGSRDLAPLIDQLVAMVQEARKLGTAAALNAARGLLAEAARLKGRLPEAAAPGLEPRPILTDDEWLAKYAPPQA